MSDENPAKKNSTNLVSSKKSERQVQMPEMNEQRRKKRGSHIVKKKQQRTNKQKKWKLVTKTFTFILREK